MNLKKSSARYWFYSVLSLTLVVPLIISGAAISAPPDKPDKAQPVIVTNTPLPVTGNVGISGTANVNVTNTTLPVTVQNQEMGIKDVNTSGGTVPVTVDNKEPFQWEQTNVEGNPQHASMTTRFMVPSGKRLVIEFLSVWYAIDTSGNGRAEQFSVTTTAEGVVASHRIPPTSTGAGAYGDTYMTALPLRMYADPGTEVIVGAWNNLPGPQRMHASISGYLVDVN